MSSRPSLALLAAALLVTTGLFASPVAAQVQDVEMPPAEVAARGHYLMGREHYAAARFAQAATEFQQAYDLSRRPQLLFNIFLAQRDAGNVREAAVALRRFIDEVPGAPEIEVLRGRLATLEAQVAAEDARAAAAREEDGEGPAPEDAGPDDSASAALATQPDATGTRSASPPTSGDGGGEAGPWVVLGVGGALAIGAVVTGALTASTHGELSSSCPGGVCPAGYDLEGHRATGTSLALTTDVLGSLAAATLAAGVVWAIVDATSTPESQARLTCTPLGCRARF